MTNNIDANSVNHAIIDLSKVNDNEHHKQLHKANEMFSVLSEASNSGIVINIIDMFQHSIMLIAGGAFAFFAHYADAFIYVFKACIRLTKAIGRTFFGIKFEEDVEKHNLTQTLMDILALLFFVATIVLLLAITISIAPTLAWISAFIGLTIVGYSDYYLTKVDAKENLDKELEQLICMTQQYLNEPKNSEKSQELETDLLLKFKHVYKLYQDYELKNKSFNLYAMLIVGIAVLLICSSATIFTTGLACTILGIFAKIASGYLAGIALFRFANYIKSKQERGEANHGEEFLSFLNERPVASEQFHSSAELFNEFSKQQNLALEYKPEPRM